MDDEIFGVVETVLGGPKIKMGSVGSSQSGNIERSVLPFSNDLGG
jgi:hypothetical protein